MNSGYIFVSDEGRHVFHTGDDPTVSDLEHARTGLDIIIRLADGCYYGREGHWLKAPPGQLGTADVDGGVTLPFHVPASYCDDPPRASPAAEPFRQ